MLLWVLLLIVRFNVTTLSHPAAFVVVYVAVLFDVLKSVPCHVKVSHPLNTCVYVVGCLIVNRSVSVDAQLFVFV